MRIWEGSVSVNSKSRARNHQTTRFRVGGWLCLFLGLIWAFSPILHGVLHISELAHHHPEGSVHEHGVAPDHRHEHASGSHAHASHSHHDSHERSSDKPEGGSQGDQETPLSPADDSPTFVFSALELTASDDISIEVELSETSHLEDEVFESVCFDVSSFVGAAGPRGPPA